MSWVYCAPKSRIRIFSAWMSIGSLEDSLHPVVRRFLGDDHVVHVALFEARGGDPDELCLAAKLLDIRGADVTHAAADPPEHLKDVHRQRAFVGNAALDPFRNELLVRSV